MLNFLQQQFIFYLTIALLLFLPGYLLIQAFWKNYFNSLEKFLFSFGLSIVTVDVIMLILGKLRILINSGSILFSLAVLFAICLLIIFLKKRYFQKEETEKSENFSFSKKQIILIIAILFLSILFKTVFLSNAIFPTATDLGHHMYWSKTIAETGFLPDYAKQNIINVDGNYQISAPENISDFIIGEHLIFAAVNLISGASFVSSFPAIILLLVNILSLIAIFVLALRLFSEASYGKNVAILALYLIGPLYAIASPQAKFVSGGVIGNVIGNLFLPIIIYFIYRALKEKDAKMFLLGLIFIFGIFYTHHLSAFIFIFAFLFSAAFFVIFNFKDLIYHLKDWSKMLISPYVLGFIFLAGIFAFTIALPTYLENNAVTTAVGTPTKDTRTGLSFQQLTSTAGQARMALGLAGIVILLILKKRKKYSSAFILGWPVALLVMSLWPNLLFVDIPSSRIASYITYPLSIAGAFALVWVFEQYRNSKEIGALQKLSISTFILIFSFITISGFYDNFQSLESGNSKSAIKTFDAANFLAKNVGEDDYVVKDHVYIVADTWIKNFLMRNYNFPFSRAYLKRYESDREMCTLYMISAPNSEDGKKCLNDLGINFIMVNPIYDAAQFQKTKDFWQVYANDEVAVFYRKEF